MKIGFIYTSPFPAKRGFSAADRRVRDLVRGLSHAGSSVDLIIPYYHKDSSLNEQETDFKTLYMGRNMLFNTIFLNRLFFWLAVLRYSLKHKIDVMFFYNTQADSVFAAKILKFFKIKIVMEICDLHSNNDSDKFSLRSSLASWTEYALPKNSDLVIVISKLLENQIQKKNSTVPIMIVPILVDSEFFQSKSEDILSLSEKKSNSFLISYVGGMWHHQGVRFLIAAFKILIEKGYDAKLLIAGKYSEDSNCDNVLKLIDDSQLSNFTILPGWVQTDEVKNILDCSDLVVISQTNNIFAQAGLPTKLAEYAACGRAILITDVGDVKNYFTDMKSCLICQPESAESMAEKIIFAINNPDITDQLGKNAQVVSDALFDFRSNGKLILEKINSLA